MNRTGVLSAVGVSAALIVALVVAHSQRPAHGGAQAAAISSSARSGTPKPVGRPVPARTTSGDSGSAAHGSTEQISAADRVTLAHQGIDVQPVSLSSQTGVVPIGQAGFKPPFGAYESLTLAKFTDTVSFPNLRDRLVWLGVYESEDPNLGGPVSLTSQMSGAEPYVATSEAPLPVDRWYVAIDAHTGKPFEQGTINASS
jgi:hypothetical protein